MARGDLARKILAKKRSKLCEFELEGEKFAVLVKQPSAFASIALAAVAKKDNIDFMELLSQQPELIRNLIQATCFVPENPDEPAFDSLDVQELPNEAFNAILAALVDLIVVAAESSEVKA